MNLCLGIFLTSALLAAPAGAQEAVDENVFFAFEEKRLLDFDINDPEVTLSLMGDLEGSSMILKVKDRSGETIGVFKPTSGNTSHISEIVAYRLCRRLDLPVCAPALHKTLNWDTLQRFVALLDKKSFAAPEGSKHSKHYATKERFRRAMLQRLRAAETLPGALKSWVSPLVLYEGLGRLDAVRKHPVFGMMRHDGKDPEAEMTELRQCTRIYKPAGCYRGVFAYDDLMEQFTGILIVDALIGNNDRFAGGNMHMFSLESRYVKEKKNWYRLPAPSLLMLDNGAGFMRYPSGALDLIRKKLKVTRFPRRQYEELTLLWEDYADDPEQVRRELGLVETFRHGGRLYGPAKVFKRNLRRLIRYMDSLDAKHGDDAWQ